MFSARFGVQTLTLVCAAITLPACATVTRGTSQQFTISSSPPGARVTTSNGFECAATPCTFRMPRKDAFRATVSMDGYVTQEHAIESKMASNGAAGMAGNVLVGGLIGVAVDATSGAMNDLTPNPLIVTLLTADQKATADAAAIALAPMNAAAPATSQQQ